MQKNRNKPVKTVESKPLYKVGTTLFFIDSRNGRVLEGKVCFSHTDRVGVKSENNKLVGEKELHTYTLETSRGDMKVVESSLFTKLSEVSLAFTKLYMDWLD